MTTKETEILRKIATSEIVSRMSRDELMALLGPPDDTGGTSGKYRAPSIYKWGTFEFHFTSAKNPRDSQELCFVMDVDHQIYLIDQTRYLSELERMTVEALYWRKKYQLLEERVDMRQALDFCEPPVNDEIMLVHILDNANIPIGCVDKNRVLPVLRKKLPL